jgi:hypothetical protein
MTQSTLELFDATIDAHHRSADTIGRGGDTTPIVVATFHW